MMTGGRPVWRQVELWNGLFKKATGLPWDHELVGRVISSTPVEQEDSTKPEIVMARTGPIRCHDPGCRMRLETGGWCGPCSRYVCVPASTYSDELGRRAIHPYAREIRDGDYSRDMHCPACGITWTEELPE